MNEAVVGRLKVHLDKAKIYMAAVNGIHKKMENFKLSSPRAGQDLECIGQLPIVLQHLNQELEAIRTITLLFRLADLIKEEEAVQEAVVQEEYVQEEEGGSTMDDEVEC